MRFVIIPSVSRYLILVSNQNPSVSSKWTRVSLDLFLHSRLNLRGSQKDCSQACKSKSNEEMALVSRCVYVLHHLQSKLDQSSPSPQAFLKYREQVVTEGTSQELKNLLEIEHQLSNEQNSLLLLIQKVKDDEKKKAFACSTQKLIVVEKKLKEISKQLNRRLMESDYVNMNLDKMLDVIHHWIKQRVEQGAQLVLSCTNDPDLLVDTTIQKKEKMMALESKMTRAITVMLKDDERIKGGENCLEALKQRIDGAKAELAVFQNGTDPTLTRRYRDIQVRKESTHRIFAYEKNKIKEG